MPKPVHNPAPPKKVQNTSHVSVSAEKKRLGILLQQKASNFPIVATLSESIKNPAHVRTELSITKNMEDFNSLRVGVTIESPCHNTDDSKIATQQLDMDLAMKMLEKEAEIVSSEWF